MGDVYDFKTGQLCKKCTICNFWKGVTDFPFKEPGRYKRGPACTECVGTRIVIDGDSFNFTMDDGGDDNEVA